MTDQSVAHFLAELAADLPSPAAGSAAAVAAAMAAALVELAARQSGEDATATRAAELRERLLPLAAEDAQVYAEVLHANGPKRRAALARATRIPHEIADAAAELGAHATRLVEHGKPSLRGEAVTARAFADAAARSAAELVRLNVTAASGADPKWRLRRRATIAGGEVAWDRFGEGPPIVLVHGTPSWSYLWRYVAPRLAERFSVYVLDLPGYGDSPPRRDGRISIASHAETLVELLDQWGVETPAAAGHDIGGAVVLRAHLVHDRPFSEIALLDAVVLAPWITPTTRHVQAHLDLYGTMPTHIFERVRAAHLRTAVARGLSDETFAAYQDRWAGERGQAAYLEMVAQLDESHTTELEPLLENIDARVLIVWGAEDAWLDPSLAGEIAERLPSAATTVIDGAGHFVTEDAPDEVAGALLGFFGS